MNAAKWQVSPLLFPGIGLGLSLRVKCPARVPLAGQHSSVAVARNVLHLEAVPLTERNTSLYSFWYSSSSPSFLWSRPTMPKHRVDVNGARNAQTCSLERSFPHTFQGDRQLAMPSI